MSRGLHTRVSGRILTRPFMLLATVFAVGMAMLAWRFAVGLGGPTAMNDGYPWGIWIAFDVVVGTAIACGGYAMAILVYIMNKGQYHPMVRSAIVTSALGYSLAGLAVTIDLGRFWNVWKLPISFGDWNGTSILLEVALCVMLYTMVAWLELGPTVVAKFCQPDSERCRKVVSRIQKPVERSMPWLLALGILLPTMHQSSLGSLMLLAGPKLHPLWSTPMLPLLFLVSCVAMGFGGVVIESILSAEAFGRPRHMNLLRGLARPTAYIYLAFAALRLVDLAFRGRLGLIATSGELSALFLAEMLLFVGVAVALLSDRFTRDPGTLFRLAMLVILAGGLYRFSTFLIAFDPGPQWSYFPSVPELLVTLGLIAGEFMAYILLVKTFPILQAASPTPVSSHS
ncbi:MAG TPA: Ni/Fe-hydrogenase cytochrome b subunit [Longimicrobiales bacterium]|nr:Ni/Fe-hydrogenase cytochrome b subunit [Longimicrobiales bacterium]